MVAQNAMLAFKKANMVRRLPEEVDKERYQRSGSLFA